MAQNGMKLMTGRKTAQLSVLFLMMVALLMAFGPILGLSASVQFGLLHGGLLLAMGLALIWEVTAEGRRRGPDDWTLLDYLGLLVGSVVALTGLSTLATVAFGVELFALPVAAQSMVFVSLALLLGRELLTE